MARKLKEIDKSARPPLDVSMSFSTDKFLMYLSQETTKLPTADILGFFSDLSKLIGDEGMHYMYEQNTSSMHKKVFDFFPGTVIPYSIIIKGGKWRGYGQHKEVGSDVRVGRYTAEVGFPDERSYVDQTKLADIIMEKAILGGCDMPPFEKPDTKCPKMYKDLMKEVQSRRMV